MSSPPNAAQLRNQAVVNALHAFHRLVTQVQRGVVCGEAWVLTVGMRIVYTAPPNVPFLECPLSTWTASRSSHHYPWSDRGTCMYSDGAVEQWMGSSGWGAVGGEQWVGSSGCGAVGGEQWVGSSGWGAVGGEQWVGSSGWGAVGGEQWVWSSGWGAVGGEQWVGSSGCGAVGVEQDLIMLTYMYMYMYMYMY